MLKISEKMPFLEIVENYNKGTILLVPIFSIEFYRNLKLRVNLNFQKFSILENVSWPQKIKICISVKKYFLKS